VCSSSNRRAFSRILVYMVAATALGAAALRPGVEREASNAAGTDAVSSSSGSAKKQNASDTVYEPGNGVTPPKLVHYVEPEFSPSSEEAFVNGLVRLSTVVTPQGIPTAVRVLAGLTKSENESAISAVQQWRFEPGTKDGEAVNVRITVEVDFHLL
jgi:periplasmic protein TonB